MSPEIELKIDNLVSSIALLVAEVREDKALRLRILSSLERIERATGVSAFYNLRQACARMGRGLGWGQHNMDKLPAPVSRDRPYRFRVEEVEAKVRELAQDPRERLRMSRRVERSAS